MSFNEEKKKEEEEEEKGSGTNKDQPAKFTCNILAEHVRVCK